LIKLNAVLVYVLKLCMKGDNPGLNNIMGDNLREIIIYV